MSYRENLYIQGFVEKCLWKFSNIKYILLVLGFKNVKWPNSQDLRTLVFKYKDSQWKNCKASLGTLPLS